MFTSIYRHDLKILWMSKIKLCLWPGISWSFLYKIEKYMIVLGSSWQADLKAVPTLSIWWQIARDNQGWRQSSILDMHKIFRSWVYSSGGGQCSVVSYWTKSLNCVMLFSQESEGHLLKKSKVRCNHKNSFDYQNICIGELPKKFWRP